MARRPSGAQRLNEGPFAQGFSLLDGERLQVDHAPRFEAAPQAEKVRERGKHVASDEGPNLKESPGHRLASYRPGGASLAENYVREHVGIHIQLGAVSRVDGNRAPLGDYCVSFQWPRLEMEVPEFRDVHGFGDAEGRASNRAIGDVQEAMLVDVRQFLKLPESARRGSSGDGTAEAAR